jgi:hypothetical protein
MSRNTSSQLTSTILIALFILFLGLGNSIRAQEATPSPTPESEELRKLKERNDILEQEKKAAELERDKAKASKEELDANFPQPSTTPLEGKTEVDEGVKIETEMVAYLSVSQAADLIVADMKGKGLVSTVNGVAIYNDRDIKALLGYMAITSQLKLMQDEYGRLIVAPAAAGGAPPQPTMDAARFIPGALTIARSVLGSFIDLIALFRTDTTVKGLSFNVEEAALVSEVFRALRSPVTTVPCVTPTPSTANPNPAPTAGCGGYGSAIKLYYPAVVPPNIAVDKEFVILKSIEDLYESKAKAEDLITEIEETEKALKEAKGDIKALKARPPQIEKELDRVNDELTIYLACRFPGCAERVAELRARRAALIKEKQENAAKLQAAKGAQAELEQDLDNLYMQIKPEKVTTSDAEKAALRRQKEESVKRLKALNAQFNKLADELIKVDGGTGINALTAYLQAENLKDALCGKAAEGKVQKCDDSYFLQLKVVSAGGNNRIRRNLIRDVFKGADISHSGGAIVEYILYDMNGKSKASNTFTVYQGYIKAKNIPDLAGENP